MPLQNKGADAYNRFAESLAAGKVSGFCIFYGDEVYLLQRTVAKLRSLFCPNGLDSFNYKRFDGKNFSLEKIENAIETMPAFGEKTLIEVHDCDIAKIDDTRKFIGVFSNLPDYVCVIFVYDTIPFKPDGKNKPDPEILELADVIEFNVQDRSKLVKWISRHFADAGKRISASDAEYLALITGGYMSSMQGEIEKISAYARSEIITRADIDAVVTPILEAVAYKMTDALVSRDYASAMKQLDDLFLMREAPHKIFFSISLKMRQLLAARICIENKLGRQDLMKMCALRQEYQARPLLDTARKMTLTECRDAVLLCADTALELNSMPEPEARIVELITKLAANFQGSSL